MKLIKITFEEFGEPMSAYHLFVTGAQLLTLVQTDQLFTLPLQDVRTEEIVIHGEEIKKKLQLNKP